VGAALMTWTTAIALLAVLALALVILDILSLD
jgi:hypothetical protein